MMAWREYQDGLCAGCGHPKATAWHPFMEGWFESLEPIVCWACTAAKPKTETGEQDLAEFPVIVDTRDHTSDPLPPNPMTT